ncbi:MAG: ammonium transporter, partial [Promethearchaeia archaeon]
MFQLAFAIITACIAAGSFAERMKLHSMLIFFFLWHCLVYCPVAHMNWHPNGILRRWGVLDFAGGNVVHILSGVTGAVGSVILGPRKLDETLRSDHTTLLTFIGGSLLFIGWFGFNAGSAFTAGTSAGWALMTTHICATTCAFTWMLVEWKRSGQPTLIGIVSGAITGLVLITPGAGFVDQTGAFVIGLVGAPICYALVVAKNYAGIDEKPA